MKITLTEFEASELIRESFFRLNLHPNMDPKTIEIIFDRLVPSPGNRTELPLMELVDKVRGWQTAPADDLYARKIAAIKAVRATAALRNVLIGLGDAKRFVELFIS